MAAGRDLERLARRAGSGDLAAAERLLSSLKARSGRARGKAPAARPASMPWVVIARELGGDPDAESWAVGTFATSRSASAWSKRNRSARLSLEVMQLEPPKGNGK